MPKISFSRTDAVAYAGLVSSVIAVIASIVSCQISQSALRISTLDYNHSRTLVLNGEVLDAPNRIKLSPHDSAFLLQEVHYKFPSDIGAQRKYVSPPGYVMDLTEEVEQYRKELTRRYADKTKDKVIIGQNARMPFLIETYSSTKGESFRSLALYTLNFRFEVGPNPDATSITLTGITFGSRLQPSENADAWLNQQWKAAQTQ